MKCINEITPRGLQLPLSALRLAKLGDSGKAEYHVLDNTVAVLKGQMTAKELLDAAESLNKLAAELHTHLANVCGLCDSCGEGLENCGNGCPAAGLEAVDLDLPEELMKKAGIPEGAKLTADADEKDHLIIVYPAGYDHDLRDVPPETLKMFHAAHVCLGNLKDLLMEGEIVYGD